MSRASKPELQLCYQVVWHEFVDTKTQLFTLETREFCKQWCRIDLQDEPSVAETNDSALIKLALRQNLF